MARIGRVTLENARDHAYLVLGEPMLTFPARIIAVRSNCPTESGRTWFEDVDGVDVPAAWPEVGSRTTTRIGTGQDLVGAWVVVQAGAYRYDVREDAGLRVRSVVHEYIATKVRWD